MQTLLITNEPIVLIFCGGVLVFLLAAIIGGWMNRRNQKKLHKMYMDAEIFYNKEDI